jgi:hypothetical protein
LKVRFGEQAFSMCDVMIKDMQAPRSASRVTLSARSVTHWHRTVAGFTRRFLRPAPPPFPCRAR